MSHCPRSNSNWKTQSGHKTLQEVNIDQSRSEWFVTFVFILKYKQIKYAEPNISHSIFLREKSFNHMNVFLFGVKDQTHVRQK